MDTIRDLELARAKALGTLLGMVDCVILALDNPTVFDLVEQIESLRDAKKEYRKASEVYLDARLAQ